MGILRRFGSGETPPALRKLEALTGAVHRSHGNTGFVYLVLDCSWSMEEGSKMEQAQHGALRFATEAVEGGYAVGIIHFATTPYRTLKPQRELHGFATAIGSVAPGGFTNMAAAIELGVSECAPLRGEKVLCIVTDGMPDSEEDALTAAARAKRADIEIMAIGVDDADEEFLGQLATRKELAVKVRREELQEGIASMALLLSSPKKH